MTAEKKDWRAVRARQPGQIPSERRRMLLRALSGGRNRGARPALRPAASTRSTVSESTRLSTTKQALTLLGQRELREAEAASLADCEFSAVKPHARQRDTEKYLEYYAGRDCWPHARGQLTTCQRRKLEPEQCKVPARAHAAGCNAQPQPFRRFQESLQNRNAAATLKPAMQARERLQCRGRAPSPAERAARQAGGLDRAREATEKTYQKLSESSPAFQATSESAAVFAEGIKSALSAPAVC
jgi:hypothetical protein